MVRTLGSELTNIALVVFAFGSILLRNPFTLQYAKESTPEEYWATPLFLHINYVITAVWALAFTWSAVVGLFGDALLHDGDNFWTGWILQLLGTFFAISFTEWYPEYAPNKAAQAQGLETEPPQSIFRLFDFFAGVRSRDRHRGVGDRLRFRDRRRHVDSGRRVRTSGDATVHRRLGALGDLAPTGTWCTIVSMTGRCRLMHGICPFLR